MLLLGPRRATYAPLSYFAVGALFTGVGLAALTTAGEGSRTGALTACLLGAVSIYLACGSCRKLSANDEALLVRGFRKQRSFDLRACAFGVRLTTGRSPSYVVFVTDGSASEDIGEWSRERGARSAVAHLETVFAPPEASLVGGPAKQSRRRERARRQVAAIENEWKSAVAVGERAVRDYYQSRTWRFTKYAIAGGLVLYVLGASLYFYLTGQ
jgi:hypothetical protein